MNPHTTPSSATADTWVRPALLEAGDEEIDDAVQHADPMVLRALLYQLTGDQEIAATKLEVVRGGFGNVGLPGAEDAALLRRKAAEFLKRYRESGAGEVDLGPAERLAASLRLGVDDVIADEDVGLYIEELALDPWARSLRWQAPPPERREGFSVTVIGAGLGGLNAAVQLKRAGIPFTVIEKNSGVGGTWHENRYPGVRVDTQSRAYTHIFGAGFGYPNPFCPGTENERYFNWVADEFDVRDDIVFDTEVRSLTWDDAREQWELVVDGPQGERLLRTTAVITAVGYLNRPKLPEIEGMLEFQGPSWHTARWPDDVELENQRVAVIGTGCTGIQLVPELALQATHVTVFQRTPQWTFQVPGYRSPYPPQVNWLDRNFPFYTNFARFRAAYGIWRMSTLSEIDPQFDDPHACSAANKAARDSSIAFLESKIDDPQLLQKMIPAHPVWSARPVLVDPQYSYLDAIQGDKVTLVTGGIREINRTGIRGGDGIQHDVDVIVYATGFHATEYLFPMQITGRNGRQLEEYWSEGGARSYLGCMVAGFPNLWSIYGPNTNGGLNPAAFHELTTLYALQCIERLVLDDKRSIEVREDAYWRHGKLVDERNAGKIWSDPRADNYYWTKHGRSATMCPFFPGEVWHMLRRPDFEDLEVR